MKQEKTAGGCGACGYYLKTLIKFLLSHIGLVSLVVGYTIIGAFTFERLEADEEIKIKKNVTATRKKVTDDLWAITENSLYFQEHLWAEKVRKRLQRFEIDLLRAIKNDGWDGREDTSTQQWTFAGALFYSIVVITTIGYGHLTPKTPWGKVVTIFYAIPGVPLMMLCLANIGDSMARSFRFLYWNICCYMCTKKPKKKRKGRSSRMSQRSSQRMHRPVSTRRSVRGTQKYPDEYLGDFAYGGNYPGARMQYPHQPRDNGSGLNIHDKMNGRDDQGRESFRSRGLQDRTPTRSSERSSKSDSHNTPNSKQEKLCVLYNKYALDDDKAPFQNIPEVHNKTISREKKNQDTKDLEMGQDNFKEPEVMIYRTPRSAPGSLKDHSYSAYRDSPTSSMPEADYYAKHEQNQRFMRPDKEYYSEEYYVYEDEEDDEEDESSKKPVPIWLGVMLVVMYIFGGGFLFSQWENWRFLDSVYFCFITLTTIGFGDFVPAQAKKKDAEFSIALCSIYLLFGIALLAMSFNLVQEEVINKVKKLARGLGLIKGEDEDDEYVDEYEEEIIVQ